ncbi:hypothetical protein FH972_023090 [Carpinus fangiana]|uniref:DUF3824 domain-containing protein n=1 Tax=Carpinus fangiana TaxID=176857 RepID=A0A5N6KUS3_9ROSI|nr:hypothetical protein FH972_023090 [Carpinus fangiana]
MASVRDWDDGHRSDRGTRPVTIRRYKISDADDHGDDRWETSSRVSRRETEPSVRSHSRGVTTREYRFERQVSRSPSPEVRQIRIEREVSRDPPRRDRGRDDYELDHYTRSTEYYERERPERERERSHHREPQTIIIKNEAPTPIIIRERENTEGREVARVDTPSPVEEKKEELLEVTTTKSHRSASVDDRQLARREQSPDEDYYYQRTTREIARRPRDDYDDYHRSRRREPDNDNYSDDDVYYRRTEYTDPDEHTIRDPNHRRHLLEGAAVGLGAAALRNHDRKKKGEKSGGAGNLIGGAAIGAAGTELYSRARQHWGRERSRSRGRYDDRDREESHHHGILGENSNMAKLGAVAVIGALAGYAASRKGGKKDSRRSRSRRRRHSRGGSRSRSSSAERAPSAAKRNSTIAGAGLASAAVAGLVERARSKSRPGRSRSRLRTGLPIAAAGLGGAALAGLYENKKAKKSKEHAHARSVSRSPSRDRSRSVGPEEHSREVAGDDHLIEYGGGSIAPDFARPRSRADSYYSDYGRRRGSPSSVESSPRRHRSSRGHGAEEGAAAGGMAGIAAHEASKRRERKRAERERRREEEDRNDTPQQGYGFGPYAQEPPPPAAMPPSAADYNNQYYPQPPNFAPPPNAYSPVPNFTGQAPYNPQEFAQPQPQYAPQAVPGGAQPYGYPAAPAPAEGNDARYQQQGHQVSHEPSPDPSFAMKDVGHGSDIRALDRSLSSGAISPLNSMPTATPRVSTERRASRVHFNLEPETRSLSDGSVTRGVGAQSDGQDAHGGNEGHQHDESLPSDQRGRARESHRSASPASDESDETIVLPDRFDREGRKKRERGDDPLADAIQDMLQGRGSAGQMLHRFAGDLIRAGPSSGRRRNRDRCPASRGSQGVHGRKCALLEGTVQSKRLFRWNKARISSDMLLTCAVHGSVRQREASRGYSTSKLAKGRAAWSWTEPFHARPKAPRLRDEAKAVCVHQWTRFTPRHRLAGGQRVPPPALGGLREGGGAHVAASARLTANCLSRPSPIAGAKPLTPALPGACCVATRVASSSFDTFPSWPLVCLQLPFAQLPRALSPRTLDHDILVINRPPPRFPLRPLLPQHDIADPMAGPSHASFQHSRPSIHEHPSPAPILAPPQLPNGHCGFRDLSSSQTCGCRRFCLNNTAGSSLRASQVGPSLETAWCFCGHHACYHEFLQEQYPSSVLSGQAYQGPQRSQQPLTSTRSSSQHMHQYASGLGLYLDRDNPPKRPMPASPLPRHLTFDSQHLPSTQCSPDPQSDISSVVGPHACRQSPSRAFLDHLETQRRPAPTLDTTAAAQPQAQEYYIQSATEVATPSLCGTPLLRTADDELENARACINALTEGGKDVDSTSEANKRTEMGPPSNVAVQSLLNVNEQLKTHVRALRQILSSKPGLLSSISNLDKRMDALETVSLSHGSMEEVHDRFEYFDGRLLEIEGKVDELERHRTNVDDDAQSRKKTAAVRQMVGESFDSEMGNSDTHESPRRNNHAQRLLELEQRLAGLEDTGLPSILHPWDVEVVMLPWGHDLKGIWSTDVEASQASRIPTQDSSGVLAHSGSHRPHGLAHINTKGHSRSTFLSQFGPEWPAVDKSLLWARACGATSGSGGRVHQRLKSRGFVRTVAISSNDARSIHGTVCDAFGDLLEMSQALDRGDSSNGNAPQHSSLLGFQSPFVPLRKVHKSSRLRFLSLPELATPLLWTGDFLSSDVFMKAPQQGLRRLFITTPAAYIQSIKRHGWTWQKIRELPRADLSGSSFDSASKVLEADAKEDCWAYDTKLDPEPISIHSSFASKDSFQKHGSFASSHPLSPQKTEWSSDSDGSFEPGSDQGHGSPRTTLPQSRRSNGPITPTSDLPPTTMRRTVSLPTSAQNEGQRQMSPRRQIASFDQVPPKAPIKRPRASPGSDDIAPAVRGKWAMTPRRSREPGSPSAAGGSGDSIRLSTAPSGEQRAAMAKRGATPSAYATPFSNSFAPIGALGNSWEGGDTDMDPLSEESAGDDDEMSERGDEEFDEADVADRAFDRATMMEEDAWEGVGGDATEEDEGDDSDYDDDEEHAGGMDESE